MFSIKDILKCSETFGELCTKCNSKDCIDCPEGIIDEDIFSSSIDKLKVDKTGLDETDHNLLIAIKLMSQTSNPANLRTIYPNIGFILLWFTGNSELKLSAQLL